MEKLSLDQIKKELDSELEKQTISGKNILDRFCVIDESSRKSAAYVDPKYAPFYYYLGKKIKAQSLLEVGFNIGLLSSSFLLSCKSVENFFGFKETTKEFNSDRIGKQNIKKNYKKNKNFYIGEIYEEKFNNLIKQNKWDVAIINEEQNYDKQLQYLETIWPHMSDFGIVVVEYINSHKASKEAFDAFGEDKNKVQFKTRYGTGIIQNG